mmetsp:Transcript_30375/g.42527  ORF Transcript_30375/g.42527 Transcript_30375/m.42527 type:complete len:410 (+) Transcript_30375:33-1262(+)
MASARRLLEVLALLERLGLASELALPAEEVLEELLLGSVVGVDLGEGVAVVVGHILDDVGKLGATEHPGASDLGLGLTEEADGAESVLVNLAGLHALAEASDQVAGLEEDVVLVSVLVLGDPEGVALEVKVVPEPSEDLARVISVAVHALPLLEVEGGLRERVEGVALLGGLGLSGLGGLLGGLSLSLGGRGLGDLGLLAEGDLTSDLDEGLLVDAGVEPPVDVGVLLAEASVEHHLVERSESLGDDDVGKSQAVAHEEGPGLQVLVEGVHGLLNVLNGELGGLGVLLDDAEDGVEPDGAGHLDLTTHPVEPLLDLGLLNGGAAEELCLVVVEASAVASDGVALPHGSLGGLEHGHLAKRVHLEELRGLVGLAHLHSDLGDINAVVLGGDHALEGARVLGVGPNLQRHG